GCGVPGAAWGGIADGVAVAARLAVGGAGAWLGRRFAATPEAELADPFKKAILDSDGTDTIVTDVSDILMGGEWPGAYARVARNRLIERWLGRPNDVRRHREQLLADMFEARKRGDVQESIL